MVTANYEVIKSVNTSLVLDALRIYKTISRSDLARITGLTTGTITNISQKLLELGLIKESGSSGQSTGGRKPILLSLNEKGAYAIAISVKTNGIEARLVDFKSKIIQSYSKSGVFHVEDGIKVIVEAVDYLKAIGKVDEKLIGIGISLPGWIDYSIGKVVKLPNLLGWENSLIIQELESILHIPVFIDNDANLAALGELWFGKGKLYHHMAYILVDDGIGAGFILNHQIYRGNGISTGELGHIPIVSSGKKCSCGNSGCLDTVSSTNAMIEKYLELTGEKIDFVQLVKKLSEKESQALKIVEEAANYIGTALSMLINLLHPQAIVLGGKTIDLIPDFIPLLKQVIQKKALPSMVQEIVILSSELKENSSLLGAVALVFQSTLQPYSLNSVETNLI